MICIVFGTNNKFRSKLIRWVTKSAWSHVWIEYPSGIWGGTWAAHSSYNGVVKLPVENVRRTYPAYKVYRCNYNLEKGLQKAREYIGAKYDYGVIWNGLLLVLLRLTGWKFLWKIAARNANKFSCSEFVSSILKASNLYSGDPELTTPGDLELFCRESDSCMPWTKDTTVSG